MAMTDEQKQKLEALRAKRVEWTAADRDRADLQELEELEYEASLRTLVDELEQKLGKRGKNWDVVLTQAGPIAVKIGEAVCYSKLLAALNSDDGAQLADMQDFIMPNLANMSREEYIGKCGAFPAIPITVWPLLAKLYRGEKDRAAGK